MGAPQKLTYYADMLKFYRALAAATPRVKVETIGKSDEGRELVVVWVSSDQNMKALQLNRDNLAKLADPRGLSEDQVRRLIAATKPNYHVIGGLHSTETGSSEMLMELVYRIATETSPLITQIRNNVYVSVTPAADADGRDRATDWFYQGLDLAAFAAPNGGCLRRHREPSSDSRTSSDRADQTGSGQRGHRDHRGHRATAGGAAQPDGARAPRNAAWRTLAPSAAAAGAAWARPDGAKYVYHDNNRDINVSLSRCAR